MRLAVWFCVLLLSIGAAMMISSNAPHATLASSFLRQTNQPMITHQHQSVDDKATRIVIILLGAADHDVPKYYQPDNVSILNNTAMTWINDDTAIHTATANDASSFDTGIIPVGANATVILKGEAGNIQYHCTIHPWMKGSLTIFSSLTHYPFGNSSQLEQQYHQQTQGKIIAAGPALCHPTLNPTTPILLPKSVNTTLGTEPEHKNDWITANHLI